MKKILVLMFLGLLIISSLILVSAKTIVAGTIFNEDYTETMEEANVTVSCVHDNVTSVETTLSALDGVYGVEFYVAECDDGDTVSVYAEKGEMSGTETGIVHDFDLTVNLAIINVTIPEFGLLIGAFTLVAGAGIFFLVRRK